MKSIKRYALHLDADLAKSKLESAGVPAVVIGVDVAMEGGAAGVQLLVPDEYVEVALKVLDDS